MRGPFLFILLALTACSGPVNSPHGVGESAANVLFAAFSERPKHLDPARAYSENEMAYIGQIYEPPLQYHYLKRPFTLEPLTLRAMPRITRYDAAGRRLPGNAHGERVAKTVYELALKPGIRYQPHPALARDARGSLRYHGLPAAEIARMRDFSAFAEVGSRELVAADYVHQIKRLADPRVSSPIFGLMGEYIVGLKALGARLEARLKRNEPVDLTEEALEGVEVVDHYTWRIQVQGNYPQFIYWLAMPFFAPVPPEADAFYAQPGMAAHNFSLDWQPIGTGAFYLAENDPNRIMVLRRNPNYHPDTYPTEGEAGDAAAGLLADAGRPLPFLDAAVYRLEKEDVPYWNKFLQGYYDTSGIASDIFDQAIRVGSDGRPDLSLEMRQRGMALTLSERSSLWYLGFNWLDPLVGGDRGRALRQAVSIALDWEEFISIFLNGRGTPAHGPLPPGIAGFKPGAEGINPMVWRWNAGLGRAERRSLAEARALLAEAGYPDGRDARTGAPLTLYFDTMASGPEAKARLDWYRKQFARLGIQLVVRATDYNRFQDKMLKGNAQIFEWGWNADYPDPENFMFLLYGPNRKQGLNGENAANYQNAEFDRLFDAMKGLPNGSVRQAVIDRMVDIVRRDAPWVFAYTAQNFALRHGWVAPFKPNPMAHNTLKYRRVDPALRLAYQTRWNRPLIWPAVAFAFLVAALAAPVWRTWRRQREATVRA